MGRSLIEWHAVVTSLVAPETPATARRFTGSLTVDGDVAIASVDRTGCWVSVYSGTAAQVRDEPHARFWARSARADTMRDRMTTFELVMLGFREIT